MGNKFQFLSNDAKGAISAVGHFTNSVVSFSLLMSNEKKESMPKTKAGTIGFALKGFPIAFENATANNSPFTGVLQPTSTYEFNSESGSATAAKAA